MLSLKLQLELMYWAPLIALLVLSLGLVALKRISGLPPWLERLAAPPFYLVSLPVATLLASLEVLAWYVLDTLAILDLIDMSWSVILFPVVLICVGFSTPLVALLAAGISFIGFCAAPFVSGYLLWRTLWHKDERERPSNRAKQHPAQVEGWISRFNSLPGSQVFLNMPGKPGGSIIITDNPACRADRDPPSWSPRWRTTPSAPILLRAILLLVLLAPAFAAEIRAQPTPSSRATKLDQTNLDVPCPSKDFNQFLSAFSERTDIQKRYTHLPLQYGDYADISGNRIKWRRIRRMNDIPQFIPETGMVLRSESQRADKGLNLRIENGDREQLREAAILFEGGGDIRYYFDLMEDCWYLYAIKDEF